MFGKKRIRELEDEMDSLDKWRVYTNSRITATNERIDLLAKYLGVEFELVKQFSRFQVVKKEEQDAT